MCFKYSSSDKNIMYQVWISPKYIENAFVLHLWHTWRWPTCDVGIDDIYIYIIMCVFDHAKTPTVPNNVPLKP